MAKEEIQKAFLNTSEMQQLFGRGRSWILRNPDPDFPKARKLGGCLGWRTTEVKAYIENLPVYVPDGMDAIQTRNLKYTRVVA